MSVKVMAEVFQYSRSVLGARLVLLAIADSVDDEHRECWPGVETLARKARLTGRAVQYAVEKLIALGELEVRPRPGHSNVWHIPPMATWHAVGDPCSTVTSFTPEDISPLKSASPGGETGFVGGTKPASPISVIEPSKIHQGGTAREKTRAPTHRLPPDMALTEERLREARGLSGFSRSRIEDEWAKMADTEFHRAHSDWSAVWRNWIRREVKDEAKQGRMMKARQADREQADRARRAETGRVPSEPTRLGAVLSDAEQTRRMLDARDREAERRSREDVGL